MTEMPETEMEKLEIILNRVKSELNANYKGNIIEPSAIDVLWETIRQLRRYNNPIRRDIEAS